ncbi:MAG: S8 family serine peptidase, partial [candidate division KSB1 bacterium]|nr:S8 family serine peptidase [candidate division KSB1 bacterium]
MKRFLVSFILFSVVAALNYAQGPTPGTWLYDQNENKVDDRIETLARAHPDSLIGMIVDFRHHPEEQDEMFLRNFGEINYRMQYLSSISVRRVRPNVAFNIAESKDVVMVELDEIVYMSLDVSARAIRARQSNVYPNSAWGAGFRGRGVNIAILDTGVDDGHPSLNDMDDNPSTTDPKFIAGYDATANPRVATNPDDDNTHYWNGSKYVKGDVFHGTHVAGIALGTGGGTDTIGVAPEAKLIDVKVLDYCGTGTSSDIIAGIEWCINNRNTAWPGQPAENHGIDILNLSLGGSKSDGQDALSRAVNKAVDLGLVVVCAVGNHNQTNYIITPAAADAAISVGSVNDQGTITRTDDVISSHSTWGSNRGPRTSDKDTDQMDELKPDVTAYGSFIKSAKGINPGQNATAWQNLSGTSMATPHVAGVCALILQAHPQFQPHDVKNVLRATAEDKNGTYNSSLDAHYDVDYGWGIVDAHAAVTTTNIPPDLWISRKPVWWNSEDIWFAHPPFVVGQTDSIYARIHNTSGTAASGVTIRFQAGIFGMGQPKWLWKKDITISVPGTGTTVAGVPWTPTAGMLVKGPGHPCVRVEIIYAQDTNTSNNMAQKNITVQPATGAGTFTFRAWNPFDARKKAFFGLDRVGFPPGWSAYFAPDALFDLNYADSVDISGEVFPSRYAQPGDRGVVNVAEFFKGTIEPAGGVTFELIVRPAPAKIALPDTFTAYLDTLFVPIFVSTDSAIGVAQFVVDYNETVAQFIGAKVGPNASGFSLMTRTDLPFPPSTFPETNKNLLVQLNGGGTRFFRGQNQKVALLGFVVVDSTMGHSTPLIFDRGMERTFLTTSHLHDLRGDELTFFGGSIQVRKARWPITVMVKYDLIDPPRPVAGVEITLIHREGTMRNTTGDDGRCVFSEVPEGPVTMSLSKTSDDRGAITGADALLTLRYLAFLEQLSESQKIAADVTLDTLLTGADALAILRYLAFFTMGIARTGSWEFVGVSPLPIPHPVHGETRVEVNAYMLGDVTLNWGVGQTSSVSGEHKTSNLPKDAAPSEVSLSLGEVEGRAGEQVLVPVAIQINGNPANTLIFTVGYDPACLEYQSTFKTALSEHFLLAANGTVPGKIHIAMAGVPVFEEGGEVVQMAFKAKKATN